MALYPQNTCVEVCSKNLSVLNRPTYKWLQLEKSNGCYFAWADPEAEQVLQTPLKNHKNIGFPSNIDPDSLKIHKASKLAFSVGSSWAFYWRADDGPFIVIFGPYIPSLTKERKKTYRIGTPSDETFWIRACISIDLKEA